MAQSISSAQNELLRKGSLDTLGSGNSLFRNINGVREYSITFFETESALYQLAGFLIDEANKNLHNGGNVSSGALSESHKIINPEVTPDSVKLDIEALEYYKYINSGVKGTKSGSGAFAFQNSFPSKKMVESVRGWMKRAGLSTSNVKRPIPSVEGKRKAVSQIDSAYAMARSIKMKGIKSTGYLDKAIQTAQTKAGELFGKALAIDFIRGINGTER